MDTETTPPFSVIWLGGLPISNSTLDGASAALVRLASMSVRKGIGVHLVNAYTVSLAHTSPAYSSLLRQAAINLPDGKPLSWVRSRRGERVRQIRGPALFQKVMDEGRQEGLKHFLLGSTDAVLAAMQKELQHRYPGVEIVGVYSPPFRQPSQQEIDFQDNLISKSGADIVWVGLGTPQQDYEVERIADNLPIVAIAIGAAFDFTAGTRKEAPRWMSKFGLEWAFRLATEPRRLWKRYLLGNFIFLWAIARRRQQQ